MKYYLYLLIFIFSSEIIAQEFTVSGTLLDEQNKAIAYANVLLLDEEGKIVTGTSTSELGHFNLKDLEAKTYTLTVLMKIERY